jgi:hypothetical protein
VNQAQLLPQITFLRIEYLAYRMVNAFRKIVFFSVAIEEPNEGTIDGGTLWMLLSYSIESDLSHASILYG